MNNACCLFELAANRDSPFIAAIEAVATMSIPVETIADVPGFTLLRGWLADASAAALFVELRREFSMEQNQLMFLSEDDFPLRVQELAIALGASLSILNEQNEPLSLGFTILSRSPLFDQGIVNLYEFGQGIREHADLAIFEDGIVGVSLGASCEFTLRRRDERGEVVSERVVTLNSGDVYLLRGDARTNWTHEICGSSVKGERISVTLRKLVAPTDDAPPHPPRNDVSNAPVVGAGAGAPGAPSTD
jgi:hypothetical protein